MVKEFRLGRGRSAQKMRAVDDVSLTCAHGETIGVVGESGCGKTTLGRIVARFVKPTSGSVTITPPAEGKLSRADARAAMSAVQMVYQNPAESLDPRWKIATSVAEPLHGVARAERRSAAIDALESVGLSAAIGERYPHQLSGGQQQRACIARAVIGGSRLIVLDEATSGLDVVRQQEILLVLRNLQVRRGVSYLFISHDLPVVIAMSHRIVVIYLGRIVETWTPNLNQRFLHPYSVALHAAQLGRKSGGRQKEIVLSSELVGAGEPTLGCRFAPRCPIARERCRREDPPLAAQPNGEAVACFYPGELHDV